MMMVTAWLRRAKPAAFLLLFCCTGLTGRADAGELTLLRTIGADDGEVLIHRPEQIVFGPDGSAYVLNGGDCTVLRFDREWNHIGSFAQCGQGPGEFENATGMLLHRGMLWIFETARATLFDLEGKYVETRRAQVQLQAPMVHEGDIICRLDGSDRAACRVNDQLELIDKLGPSCPSDDFFERYKKCGFMHLLLHPDYLCLLINPIDGMLYAVKEDGDVARTVSLMDESGTSVATQEDDTVSMSFTLVLGRGFVDASGRLWSLPLPPDEDQDEGGGEDEEPRLVEVRDRDFKKIATFTLPQDVRGYQLASTPNGNLVLLDAAESLIYILECPDL